MSQPYRLVVQGESLDPATPRHFKEMTVRAHGGTTEITGAVIDASHLHGLFERIASLGLILTSLAALDIEAEGRFGCDAI